MTQPPNTLPPTRWRRPPGTGDLLERVPKNSFLRLLREDQCAAFLNSANLRGASPGATLSIGAAILLLLDGWVTHEIEQPDGNLFLTLRGPGDIIGDSSLFGARMPQGVRTTGIVTLAAMSTKSFRGFLHNHPTNMAAFCSVISNRLHKTQRDYQNLNRPVAERINLLLQDLFSGRPHPERQPIHISQGDIARVLRLSRPAVENHLRSLRKAGVIDTKYREIHLRDPSALFLQEQEEPENGWTGEDRQELLDSPASVCVASLPDDPPQLYLLPPGAPSSGLSILQDRGATIHHVVEFRSTEEASTAFHNVRARAHAIGAGVLSAGELRDLLTMEAVRLYKLDASVGE
ncbi:Crp/Fnr family transcriptional regulator [Kitasatospora sp. NPDC006697]|uniref:Crp/Fnr family transcriptional regulator n=1 Tax=Kitasatospora sp. NPDC006697 TaxID=3364020 RepID=UPI003699B8D8